MRPYKLFLYPQAKPHVHDLDPYFENVVPLSKKGIEDYFELVGPKDADFFYMGQYSRDRDKNFNINSFEYFKEFPSSHIIDLEGEGGLPIPEELNNSIVTVNGPLAEYKGKVKNLFTRPTFSKNLINLSKQERKFEPNLTRDLSFRGVINCQTRYLMCLVLNNQSDIKVSFEITNKWAGMIDPSDNIAKDYLNKLSTHAFALCPRGSGIDSVRVWESCALGRIPIIITDKDYLQVYDEDIVPTPFIKRIVWNGDDSLVNKLLSIIEISDEEIVNLQKQCFDYFNNVIVPYISNPTGTFIDWMKKKKII